MRAPMWAPRGTRSALFGLLLVVVLLADTMGVADAKKKSKKKKKVRP
jgi:hypothetical protein